MKTLLFILLTSGLLPLVTLAQAPVLQWERRFGNRSRPENAVSLDYSRPNRILMAGYTSIPSPLGGCCDGEENTVWTFNHRGDSVRTIFPVSTVSGEVISVTFLTPLPNGDQLLAGGGHDGTQTTQAGRQATSFMFLARADSLSNIRWIQRYNFGVWGGPSAPPILLPDGGALLLFTQNIGTTAFNQIHYAHAARVDSVGNMLWQHRYGAGFAGLSHAVPCLDGSYALAGYQRRRTAQNQLVGNAWLLQLTAGGDTIRNRYWGSLADARFISDLRPTPNGGLLLAGTHIAGTAPVVGNVSRGWLHQMDAQGNTQWDYDIVAANAANSTVGASLEWLYVLQNGDFLLHGYRNQAATPNTIGYLARWRPPISGSTTPTPVWERQLPGNYSISYHAAMAPDGSLTLANSWTDPNPPRYNHIRLSHYASQGQPYQANLCATPPQANTAFVVPAAAPDSLNLLELGTAGPTYAQTVRWRWTLGDGTVVVRTSPGWVRHKYATVPAPGTPVTVTITNNLGCTSTQVLYPFGQPTATQQARELAARASLFPNPNSGGTVTVRLPGLRAQPEVAGELLNSVGQRVQVLRLPVAALERGAAVEINDLPAGVYTLRLRPLEGAVVKRLVKQ